MPEDNGLARQGMVKNMAPVERAAVLLMSMGEKDAAEVLKKQPPQ